MMNCDELLKEDTSNIINEAKRKNKKFKLSYNIQLIITIIVGIIVIYAGGYTLYYVYLYPQATKVGEVLDVETKVDVASELLEKVPYYMGENIVYNDYGPTFYSDLDNDLITAFLIETLDSSEYMTITGCSSSKICIEVSTNTLSNKYLEYYNESINSFSESITLSTGLICTLNGNMYDCEGDESKNYTGKISSLELIQEKDEYMYIYEKALFTKNAYIDSEKLYFDYVSTKPNEGSSLLASEYYEVSSLDVYSEINKLFYKESLIYKHTFIIDNENYYWIETTVVSSLP